VKLKRLKWGPGLLALSVLAAVCGVRIWNPAFPERLERMTYDIRVREAQKYPAPAATNLAFVSLEESSIAAVQTNAFGYRFGLYWPRQVYGRVVEELAAQGANAVAFDVLFGELRPDHPPVELADGQLIESDDFFARQMRRANNVFLAVTPDVTPPKLFATNALALGDISTERDPDGILRRVRAFRDVRQWHPIIRLFAADPEISADLDHASFAPGKILLPQTGTTNLITVPVDADNNFSLADFVGDKLPPGLPPKAPAFTTRRIWHMGVVIAARELGLDLDHARVDLPGGKITLSGANGVQRIIPVDSQGCFWVNWGLKLRRTPIETVLRQDHQRLLGVTNGLRDDFRGKIVIIGSAAQGNDLTDRGATPLENDTLLVSKHWNVASSIITGSFIYRLPESMELALLVVLAALSAFLTWQLRAVAASLSVLLLLVGYTALAFALFIKFRWWLPLIYPLGGAVILQHFALVTHRMIFEESEKRRIRSVFSRVVSPNVVNELLSSKDIRALSGARREVSVFFADIRGFTTLTDQAQEQIEDYVRHSDVDLVTAEEYFEASAREMLETVNLYLAAVANVIKHQGGTLDKYIGDCVMAFWNAPTPNEKHALACVRAAIAAQRAIFALNEERQAQGQAREAENRARVSAGLPPRPPLVALQLGTGINTGPVTVGYMGSDQHIVNYTVFGREVNLASRLEGESGSGRIIISDTTYNHLLRHSPELASTCRELFPVKPKGFQNPVRIYEVPWKAT
jgi:class 3 adenylate cyclase/CHASE2 domain-containing sensor protein